MSKKPDAQAFPAAMASAQESDDVPVTPPAAAAVVHELPHARAEAPPRQPRRERAARKPTRAELKHFGGYLDDDTLEKIALLRVRLKKDNSELIKLAIEDLHRKHNAKRAFGDA